MITSALLCRVVQQHFGEFLAQLEAGDRRLPAFVTAEFEAYLDCGLLSRACLHVRCEQCGDEMVVAFSCKGRFCPSCGGRRLTVVPPADRAFARAAPLRRATGSTTSPREDAGRPASYR